MVVTFLCDCGQRHALDESIATVLAHLGPTEEITRPTGTFLVPRLYIAAHGLPGRNIKRLAEQFGWSRARATERRLNQR